MARQRTYPPETLDPLGRIPDYVTIQPARPVRRRWWWPWRMR